MHKKLEADLISLAHSILKMKNKEDVFALKEKSKAIYEKLSMLAFVEEYVNVTPNLENSKADIIAQVALAFEKKETNALTEATSEKENLPEEKVVYNLIEESKEIEEVKETIVEDKKEVEIEEIFEQPFDELEEIMFSKEISSKEVNDESSLEPILEQNKSEDTEINSVEISDVIKVEERKTMSLEEELQDIISVDVMADLFENVQPKSLNDKLTTSIQIGLNDRIAFVKNLFNNQQEDYNRVISQLNTFRSENDAKNFINKMVKPDYNWSEQEELETRFMEIIERKFA